MEKWVQTKDYKVKRDDVVLNIGDYIDYHDRAGKNGKDLYKGKWQVLGTDNEGNLLIVSESNVATHYFNKGTTFKEAKLAYSNGVQILDNICEEYANGTDAISSRSIRIEDVDKLTGYDKTTNFEYGKKRICHNEEGEEIIWHDGDKWNSTNEEKYITLINDYYNYKPDRLNKKVCNVLLGKNSEKSYWLASTYVDVRFGMANFGFRYVNIGGVYGYSIVYSNGIYSRKNNGVRAVVTIRSNVMIKRKNFFITKWKIY